MNWLSKFVLSKGGPKFHFIRFPKQLCIVLNGNEDKSVEFYFVENELTSFGFKLKPKKKIRHFWQHESRVFAIDKFGDVWKAEMEAVEKASEESKFEDLFSVTASFFSDTIDLCLSENKKLIVQTDDYYKLRVVAADNPQRLIAVHSFRPFFVCKVIQSNHFWVLFYDDFKVQFLAEGQMVDSSFYLSPDELTQVEGVKESSFFSDFQLLNEDSCVGVHFKTEGDEGKTATVHRLSIDTVGKRVKVTGVVTDIHVKEESFIVSEGRCFVGEIEVFGTK